MSHPTRFAIALGALRQLGFEAMACYALYQLGLRTGHYRRVTTPPHPPTPSPLHGEGEELRNLPLPPFPPARTPSPFHGEGAGGEVIALANELLAGQIRLFGAQPVPLDLTSHGPLVHWTEYALGKVKLSDPADIKFAWEPARFGWAFTLCQAYQLNGKEDYAQIFWRYTETFLSANPPYRGVHWLSAQETALRLIALVYSGQVFAASPHTTPERRALLAQTIADHARRIPPTLIYARAQNNNHLLSEAAGLYTAGLALASYPEAPQWREQGWIWFHRGLQKQIDVDGVYSQHSTNYHRLMLQLALWVDSIKDRPFPAASLERLAAATSWLESLIDPVSGMAPNLGANDGAYFIPLGSFADYRPVTAQAQRVFVGSSDGQPEKPLHRGIGANIVIHHPELPSWAYLRVAHFRGRPSHADQLHLDLWWRGLNLALDAGSFQYNALPPWDNALAGTALHNTVMVNGQDQMTRAGRFLWLDYAQAEIIGRRSDPAGQLVRVDASHTGYLRLGVQHWRSLSVTGHGWLVTDEMLPWKQRNINDTFTLRLHWLLPDWPWQIEGNVLIVESPYGKVVLRVDGGDPLTLIRAGVVLAGPGPVEPTWGWHSPTYGVKLPALALVVEKNAVLPVTLVSEWKLPKIK